MAKARIFRGFKNAMQSGRAKTRQWVLEIEPKERKRPDPLTGWAGSGDTESDQIKLTFPTLEAARGYAERKGLDYHVVPDPGERPIRIRTYAENFR